MSISLRNRHPDDLPALTAALAAQQPTSGYPHRWPLPFPVEEFIVRPDQDRAWVAVVDDVVAGHVAVGRVAGEEAQPFLEATGHTDPYDLALVGVLFVDPSVKGQGVGGALIAEAVAWARAEQRLPVLDVLAGPAVSVYLHLGWEPIGELRPAWLPDHLPPMVMMSLT